MKWLTRLFRRKLYCGRIRDPDCEWELFEIEIDEGDESDAQVMILNRVDCFTIARLFQAFSGGQVCEVTLSHGEGDDVVVQHLAVPKWAHRRLASTVKNLALSLGWDGVFYARPARTGPFR